VLAAAAIGVLLLPQAVILEARVKDGEELTEVVRNELTTVIEVPRSDGTAEALAVYAASERTLVVRRDTAPLITLPSEEERVAAWKRIAPEIAKRVGGHLVLVVAPGRPYFHFAAVDAEGTVRAERDAAPGNIADAVAELMGQSGGGTNSLLVPGAGKAPLRVELDPPTRSLDVSLYDDNDEPGDWLCGTPCTLQVEPGPLKLRIGSGMHAEAVRNLTLPPGGAKVRFHVFPEWVHILWNVAVDLAIVGTIGAGLFWVSYAASGNKSDDNSMPMMSSGTPAWVGWLAVSSVALFIVGEIIHLATRTRAHFVN
jgi:hypothetical protein